MLAFSIFDIVSFFYATEGEMVLKDMVLAMTGPYYHCFVPLVLPNVISKLFSVTLEVIVVLMFAARIATYRSDASPTSDSRRLEDARALVRRLLLPYESPPLPRSPLERCCSSVAQERSAQHDEESLLLPDSDGDLDIDLDDSQCCQSSANAFKKCFNPKRLLISLTTPKAAHPHSNFEKPGDFRYPTRILAAHFISVILVAIISMLCAFFYVRLSYRLDTMVELLSAIADEQITAEMINLLQKEVFYSGIFIALFAYFMSAFNSWRSLVSYRESIFQMRQGRWPFDRRGYNLFDASPYVGHHIVHSAIGVLASMFLLTLIVVAVHVIVVLPEVQSAFWRFLLVSGGIWFVQWIFQRILRVVFTQWSGRMLRYRGIYQFFDMLFFFLSTLSGLFSGVTRLMMIFAFTVLQVNRLDHDYHLPRAFDGAHASFKAILAADHTFNNPVNLVFVDLLWKKIAIQNQEDGRQDQVESQTEIRKQRARLKWNLVVLLARNPSLRRFRKHKLKERLA